LTSDGSAFALILPVVISTVPGAENGNARLKTKKRGNDNLIATPLLKANYFCVAAFSLAASFLAAAFNDQKMKAVTSF
jgi:hypothetical protein